MKTQYVLVISVNDQGTNDFHLISKDEMDAFRAGNGTSGQDRDGYSDNQDRENYSVSTEETSEFEFAQVEGIQVDDYAAALRAVDVEDGKIVKVVAYAI